MQKTPLDSVAIGRLMARLAGETARIAGRTEGKRSPQVKAQAQALEAASQAVTAG